MYELHPACSTLPKMAADEYAALCTSIRAGFDPLHPVLLFDGMILDGRHRYQACVDEDVKPVFTEWTGDDPFDFVLREHLARRSWKSQEQKALVEGALVEQSAAWQAERGRIRTEANAARAEKAKGHEFRGNQHAEPEPEVVEPHREAPLPEPEPPKRDHSDKSTKASTAKARTIGVTRAAVERAATIKRHSPELATKVAQGEVAAGWAYKQVQKQRRQEDLDSARATITEEKSKSLASVCDLRVCTCAELLGSGIKPDAVITDPPYPQEHLDTFSELAAACKEACVPLVAVMSGQSYLPEVMHRLCSRLTYQWTLAYLTPGGQSVQLWERKVNTFWKPVLLFGRTSEWIGDVCRSDTNDNDKAHHDWGQSASGMSDLIQRLTKPGQLVCDPFLGGGTTAVAALSAGRRFVGCDIDAGCVERGQARVGVME